MNVIENSIAEKFDVINEDDNVIKTYEVVGNINTVVAIS